MFVTIGTIAQYVPDMSAHVLLATGQGRAATPVEAAECVNRYVLNGDARMNEANDDFKRIYGNPYLKEGQSDEERTAAIKKHYDKMAVKAPCDTGDKDEDGYCA